MLQRLLVYLIKPPFCSVAKPLPHLISFIINIVIGVVLVNRRRCQLLNHKPETIRRLSHNATGFVEVNKSQCTFQSVLPSVMFVVVNCSDRNMQSRYFLNMFLHTKKKTDGHIFPANNNNNNN